MTVKVRRFEDPQCWQKARQLANAVHQLATRAEFARDFGLRGQIENASGSVMHNTAEGHEAGTDAEFIRFLKIARRSAGEVQSELYLALDRQYITEAELHTTYSIADEAKRLINGLVGYLRKQEPKTRGTNPVREPAAAYGPEFHQTSDKGLLD